MDWLEIRGKVLDFGKRYWYVLIVFLAGLLLMAIPADTEETEEPIQQTVVEQPDLQQELELILSQIQGAGKVRVLLSESYGSRTVYQTDDILSSDGNSNSQTVVITDADRNQYGLVHRVDPPVYLGAVVVCQGGDSATVRLAVVEAVASVTGLGADKITVLKMK